MSHSPQIPPMPGAAPRQPAASVVVSAVVVEDSKPPRVFTVEERIANIENAIGNLHGWMLRLVERGMLTTYSKEISDLRASVADFNLNRPT